MKIAGRKNNGAWFRANLAIKKVKQGETGVADLADLNAALYAATVETRDNAYTAITAMAGEAGVGIAEGYPASAALWIEHMCQNGIPNQIWMGRLSFTTYNRTGSEGAYEYHANYQSEIAAFAKQLRKAVTKWMLTRRAVRDLMDVGTLNEGGNPGGQPDATKGT